MSAADDELSRKRPRPEDDISPPEAKRPSLLASVLAQSVAATEERTKGKSLFRDDEGKCLIYEEPEGAKKMSPRELADALQEQQDAKSPKKEQAAAVEKPTASFLFGDVKPSLFGNAAKPAGSLFGDAAKPTGSLFGDAAKPAGSSLFGDAAKPAGSLFGDAAKPAGSLFGDAAKPAGSLFGDAAKPAGSLFGDAAKPAGSLFGDAAKPAGSSLFGDAEPSLFGGAAKRSEEEESDVEGANDEPPPPETVNEEGFVVLFTAKRVALLHQVDEAFRTRGPGTLKVVRPEGQSDGKKVALFRLKGSNSLVLTAGVDSIVVGDSCVSMSGEMKGIRFAAPGEDGQTRLYLLKFKLDTDRLDFLTLLSEN